ncbi:uncharacterized protein LOC144704638 [Wolffia australiana]
MEGGFSRNYRGRGRRIFAPAPVNNAEIIDEVLVLDESPTRGGRHPHNPPPSSHSNSPSINRRSIRQPTSPHPQSTHLHPPCNSAGISPGNPSERRPSTESPPRTALPNQFSSYHVNSAQFLGGIGGFQRLNPLQRPPPVIILPPLIGSSVNVVEDLGAGVRGIHGFLISPGFLVFGTMIMPGFSGDGILDSSWFFPPGYGVALPVVHSYMPALYHGLPGVQSPIPPVTVHWGFLGYDRFAEHMMIQDLMNMGQESYFAHFGNTQVDIDGMTYEEILAWEEQVGSVTPEVDEDAVQKSLKKEKYKSLPTCEAKSCCICLEEYADGEELGMLSCGHDFHASCIGRWLVQKNFCPICKKTGLLT